MSYVFCFLAGVCLAFAVADLGEGRRTDALTGLLCCGAGLSLAFLWGPWHV